MSDAAVSTGVRWIVFDYGEVISQATKALPELAAVVGVEVTAFSAAYWAERDSYDRGRPALEYWGAVGARVGVEVSEAVAAALTDADVAGWLHTDPAALDLLAELEAAGVPLALLSNAPSPFGRAAEREPWARHFRHLVFSGDLGLAKPDARIWVELTDRLGVSPGECLFLDDRQVNVDGAIRAGLLAERWSSAALIRARLVELGLLD